MPKDIAARNRILIFNPPIARSPGGKAKAALLPIQHIPDDDLGELHDQLPQLSVFFKERIDVQTMGVRSRRCSLSLTVGVPSRQVHAHG
jgi:hypothetical protein